MSTGIYDARIAQALEALVRHAESVIGELTVQEMKPQVVGITTVGAGHNVLAVAYQDGTIVYITHEATMGSVPVPGRVIARMQIGEAETIARAAIELVQDLRKELGLVTGESLLETVARLNALRR